MENGGDASAVESNFCRSTRRTMNRSENIDGKFSSHSLKAMLKGLLTSTSKRLFIIIKISNTIVNLLCTSNLFNS